MFNKINVITTVFLITLLLLYPLLEISGKEVILILSFILLFLNLIFYKNLKKYRIICYSILLLLIITCKYYIDYPRKIEYGTEFIEFNSEDMFKLTSIDYKELNKADVKSIQNIYYKITTKNREVIEKTQSGNYYYQLCLFFNNNVCYSSEYNISFINSKKFGYINFSKNQLISKRERKHWNDLKKNIFKTYYIPENKLDFVLYNYPFFMKENLEDIKGNKNECLYLLYGSQNGWLPYVNTLISKLNKDENNQCIEQISKTHNLNIHFYIRNNEQINEIIDDNIIKKDLLIFLNNYRKIIM